MKNVEVLGRFQEITVDGYILEVTERAEASTFKAAVSRAIGKILKNPSMKRKRFTTVSLEVMVIDKDENSENKS